MTIELENLKVRLHGNKLSLNVAKTISMLIGTIHNINDKTNTKPPRDNFEIPRERIEQRSSVKHLGVHINSTPT